MLSESVFWKYALEFYGRAGVTNSCLKLQDDLGLNVNLLLLLCWCEQHKKQLDGEQIDLLVLSLALWHSDYTKPLRNIRRKLALDDNATEAVKRAIFDAEMALEKTEQRLLLGIFNQFKLADADTALNLQRYIGRDDKAAVIAYAAIIDQLRTSFGLSA
jgi:uncharacterized protein (TIGR02444 family)